MDDEIGLQLKESYSLWNGINRLYAQWAKKYGLTYDSLFVLHTLYYGSGSCCQKEICEEWCMPKQTVNSILKNFEVQGYIRRHEAGADRRNKGISLTEGGRLYACDILEKLDEIERLAIMGMGSGRMQELLDRNALYYSYLKEEIEKKEKQNDS